MTRKKPTDTAEIGGEKKRRRGHFLCSVRDCGRPSYAKGYCQTHHRQKRETGKVKDIRPYQRRTHETVNFSGFRLSPECAALLQQRADERQVSRGAAIAGVLEEWHSEGEAEVSVTEKKGGRPPDT